MSKINSRKPTHRTTTMKAVADRAHRGLPPERELRVYEFGNGRVQKKAEQYKGEFNETTGEWE